MKHLKKIFVVVLLFITLLTTSSCTPSKSDPSEFKGFSEEVLSLVVGGDELTINYFFQNPEDYGIVGGNIMLPTPSSSQSPIGMILLNAILGKVDTFDYSELSFDQQMTANIIKDLRDDLNDTVTDEAYMSSNYLGSYLGYQAQLPVLLLRYNFRDVDDLDNYFAYIDLVPDTFRSYVDFEIEKADNGYGMPDFVINKVLGQVRGFLTDIDSNTNIHFMISSINKRIDELDFLTQEEKNYYKNLNIEKVRGPLANGYRYVLENLPSVLGKAKNNMGLAHYVKDGKNVGKMYYQEAFNDAVGYDIPLDEALAYLDKKLESSFEEVGNLKDYFLNNPSEKEKLTSIEFMPGSIEEQLDYYKNNLLGVYPSIRDDFNINIDYIDESIEDYFSPAAYMISAIDDFENEFILLNRSSIYYENEEGELVLDRDYLSTTLAHEGFPGHMYQNVYFKSKDVNLLRKLLTDTGYKEGWAQYSERFSYELFFDKHDEYSSYIEDYFTVTFDFEAAFYAKLDIGIHYLGWTLEETYEYINTYIPVEMSSCKAVYEQLIEVPTNYPMYFFTYLKLMDLREYALSNGMSLLDFNTLVLDCGPAPLRFVDEYIRSVVNE